MLQFGSKHFCIEDVHIFKHCHEMTLFLLWIGTYCISCVVQQTSGVKDLSSLVRYDDSCLAAIRHVQSIKPVVRPCPNKRSHSVLFNFCTRGDNINFVFQIQLIKGFVTWDKKENCFSGPPNHIFLCYVIFSTIDRLQIWRRKHKSQAYR